MPSPKAGPPGSVALTKSSRPAPGGEAGGGEVAGELPPAGRIGASVAAKSDDPLTLAIDVGGTRLKAGVLNTAGVFVAGPSRVNTPDPATPEAVIAGLIGIIGPLGAFDRVSMGFPGVVRHGRVYTAPNLGTQAWHGFPLAQELARRLGRPVRLLNDASVQGLGVITDTGLECVITLGTGFGFALFDEGRLAPHLEVGQHIARGKRTYDEYLGNAVLERIGRKKWNRHVETRDFRARDPGDVRHAVHRRRQRQARRSEAAQERADRLQRSRHHRRPAAMGQAARRDRAVTQPN